MKVVILLILLSSTISAFTQDAQFSHLYAAPLYMGPSFAGATGATRITLNARDQWSAIKNEYTSFSVMADHYFFGTRSGAGFMLMKDRAGAGKLTNSFANLYYSYSVNISKKLSLRPGLQISYANRKIDYDNIVFGDQLDFEQNRETTTEASLYEDINYLDFSSSLLGIYNNYWFGITGDHLTTPNQSLMGSNSEVPIKYSLYAGAKFRITTNFNRKRSREYIYAMVHYNQQGKARQTFIGSYWEHDRTIFGIWYRGTPLAKSYENYMNSDAFIFMLGYTLNGLTFLYSYDFTVSKLYASTAGSHEITISWVFKNEKAQNKKQNKLRVVPCPMSERPKGYHQPHTM